MGGGGEFVSHNKMIKKREQKEGVLSSTQTLNPRIEKITILAKTEVPQLIRDTIMASRWQLLCTGL